MRDRHFSGEPRLADMLADPIIRQVMARDGVTEAMILALVRQQMRQDRLAA